MRAAKSLGACLVGLVAVGCGQVEPGMQTARSGALSAICPPAVPPALVVPDGNRVAFDLIGQGVQIYQCQSGPSAFAWVFQAPEANLLNPGGQVAGTHYAGPTWEANGGSTVVGARVAGATVTATAIPWLLLRATTNTGAGRMAKITYIQRVNTQAGLAPATGCDAAHVGETARIDYTTVYYFYEARNGNGPNPPC